MAGLKERGKVRALEGSGNVQIAAGHAPAATGKGQLFCDPPRLDVARAFAREVAAMLDRSFFQRDPVTCARELIGCELVWRRCSGIVVETEAYAATNDEACHTFARPSARSFVAQHRAGAAYVYFNYGMYWLLNVLVKGGSEDGFVLFRAIEPTRGVETMTRRRLAHRNSRLAHPRQLCSGPGKLALALGVDGKDHGRDLCALKTIGLRPPGRPVAVVADVRIGISKAAHLPWRFLLRESEFVSARPRMHAS